ncbi:MAG: LysM peptidoglycan-binding domain-containing protein [Actinobacteria bacterium]|nr:LysM peptidoglycan-binding domain-containing protein [Actinomycetota bacterium]
MSNEPIADPDEPHGTQILWGRVLVLLLALALAFWLGTTFGGDDRAQRQLSEQRDEITRLRAQITSLEAELTALDAGAAVDDRADEAAASETPSDVAAAQTSRRDEPREKSDKRKKEETRPEGRTYVIQSGDSLASIAQEVYGDPTMWRDIARANELREPYSLTVGESLQIPEVP